MPGAAHRPFLLPIRSFRPPNAIEQREGGENIVAFNDNLTTCQLRSTSLGSGPEKDGFTFDRVFPMGTQQAEVFDYGVKESVHAFHCLSRALTLLPPR